MNGADQDAVGLDDIAVPGLMAPSHVLLAYVDESYTDDHFFLGAVVVDGESAARLEGELNEIVSSYAGQFGLTSDTELHGYELFQGEKGWSAVPTRARINIHRRAMHAIGASGARIVLRGMDCKRQRERYRYPSPPHEVVLGHMLERINRVARDRRDWALVVADEVHNDERHRTNFRDFRRTGTPGYRSSTLPRLLDTLHFGPSHFSRGLQAADLVTYMHRRRQCHTETDARAERANEQIWSGVTHAVEHSGYWRP